MANYWTDHGQPTFLRGEARLISKPLPLSRSLNQPSRAWPHCINEDEHSISRDVPGTPDIQTLQPRLSVHGPIVLLILLGAFLVLFFLKQGVNRIAYCAFSLLAIAAVLLHFLKEYRLIHDRLTAVGVVTDYRVPFSSAPRILRFFIRKFSPDVPIAKYSFVAFDQKTYTGQTGWHTHVMYKGAKIIVLYKPGKPSVNHPVSSFIFYSFH